MAKSKRRTAAEVAAESTEEAAAEVAAEPTEEAAAEVAAEPTEEAAAEEDNVYLKILRRPESLRDTLIQLQERATACWERCVAPPTYHANERVTASRNIRSGENGMMAFSAVETKIWETRKELSFAMDAVNRLLDRLESLPGINSCRNALLLRARYLDGMSWKNVCIALRNGGFPVTLRTVFKWRDVALKQLNGISLAGIYAEEERPNGGGTDEMNVIKVRFLNKSGLSATEYSYYAPETVAIGDKVYVGFHGETKTAIVSQVNVPREEILVYGGQAKAILGKYAD